VQYLKRGRKRPGTRASLLRKALIAKCKLPLNQEVEAISTSACRGYNHVKIKNVFSFCQAATNTIYFLKIEIW